MVASITLTELRNICTNLSPIQCDFYSEGAVVALESQEHVSGIGITVDGDFNENIPLTWDIKPNTNGWKEGRDSTEFGALAIAFFLVTSLTEYQVIEQSPIGTGFDYYLGYQEEHPDYDPDNFINAWLEVSGLAKGTPSEISDRVREKMVRIEKTGAVTMPGYVSVTAFGRPISYLKKK